RDTDRTNDGHERAEETRTDADENRADHRLDVEGEREVGEAEEGTIERDHAAPEHSTEGHSDQRAAEQNHEHELEVVLRDLRVAVPERLERRDLRPLESERAHEDDVDQEGGNPEE